MTGGVSGKPIVPGKASESLLLQRILGSGEQARMPMGGKPLAADKVAIIRQWIASGAIWPDATGAESAEIKKHWAFIAPKTSRIARREKRRMGTKSHRQVRARQA